MRITLTNNLEIEVSDEPFYTLNSTDNKFLYLNVYGDHVTNNPTAKHGIKIYENQNIISSCLILGFAGCTGVHPTSFIINDNSIVICCSNDIYCLSLPLLTLKWKATTDDATCFQIFKIEKDYVIHGELSICRIDEFGNILWTFCGRDIFVSTQENSPEFILLQDRILLSDFNNQKYVIDFHGKEL